jgi:NADH dehydrogenase
MGVDVMTSSPVLDCDERGVDLADGRIEAGSVIWAAGIMASPAAQWVSTEHDRGGRVVVSPDLSLPGFNNIFVIGDTASVKDANAAICCGDPLHRHCCSGSLAWAAANASGSR